MIKKYLIAAVVLVFAAGLGGVVWYLSSQNDQSNQSDQSASKPPESEQKKTRLDIELKDGKLTHAPNIYLVKPGTIVEFHIKSNKMGKVGVPTDPPQTISFTESPLIFHFTVTDQTNEVLTYQAEGSDKVIPIGTITVKTNQ